MNIKPEDWAHDRHLAKKYCDCDYWDHPITPEYDGESNCRECGAPLNNATSYKDSGLCPKCWLENRED